MWEGDCKWRGYFRITRLLMADMGYAGADNNRGSGQDLLGRQFTSLLGCLWYWGTVAVAILSWYSYTWPAQKKKSYQGGQQVMLMAQFRPLTWAFECFRWYAFVTVDDSLCNVCFKKIASWFTCHRTSSPPMLGNFLFYQQTRSSPSV